MLIRTGGIDVEGHKHPLGRSAGATETAATGPAPGMISSSGALIPPHPASSSSPRLVIVDGAKALSAVLRRTFGADVPIQRCQIPSLHIHGARTSIDRRPDPLPAAVRAALRKPRAGRRTGVRRSPAPTALMHGPVSGGRPVGMSNAGAMPGWGCGGRKQACLRPRRAFGVALPNSSVLSSGRPAPATGEAITLTRSRTPH